MQVSGFVFFNVLGKPEHLVSSHQDAEGLHMAECGRMLPYWFSTHDKKPCNLARVEFSCKLCEQARKAKVNRPPEQRTFEEVDIPF